MRTIILLFSLFHAATLLAKSWQVIDYSLDGQWQLEIVNVKTAQHDQHLVNVPHNWVTSGIDHSGEAYYSRQFTLNKLTEGSRYWLELDAVDYESLSIINGKRVGEQAGYFIQSKSEITPFIKVGINNIDIWVNSPDEVASEDWSLHKTLIKGVLNHHDTRPGGAWSLDGQDRNSGGIWGSVRIRETGPVAVSKVNIRSNVDDVDSELTRARAEIELDSQHRQTASIELKITPKLHGSIFYDETEFYRKEVELPKGGGRVDITLPQLKRRLWWPWDWGEPVLYDVDIEVLIDGVLSDRYQNQFGFRTVDFNDENATFYLNEQPYFIRGTNYIASQWLGSMSKEDYHHDLTLMQKANVNSVRVHAHVAGNAFYNAADELGFIVWQDFPLQWGYVDNEAFILEAQRQAQAMTLQLSNHPSIAFWCGQNEPPWDATWMQYKYSTYQATQNIALTKAVAETLGQANDGRIVRAASYTNEHPWLGWYSGSYKDYADFSYPAIVSEFGAQAFPNWQLFSQILGKEDSTWPWDDETVSRLIYHNYQPHETINIAGVSLGEDKSHFWINSQEYQRVVTKYATERLRLNRFNGLAAIYQFMFVDSWPSISWSVLDVNRQPKPGYFALQQAFQPLLPILSITYDDEKGPLLSVDIVNDGLRNYNESVVTILTPYSETSWQWADVSIAKNQKVNVANELELDSTPLFFSVVITNQEGVVISENRYQPQDF
ncbi:glycoside hydrolase family 2 protein [Thaumasiovibrio sp. DFM-14]|uniref:glycoside hydrolase family 2 protein n=1 Tax=Thaumasiovibrio sp. DFM-14 TaxID=3384792 RepID=UPI00399F8F53